MHIDASKCTSPSPAKPGRPEDSNVLAMRPATIGTPPAPPDVPTAHPGVQMHVTAQGE